MSERFKDEFGSYGVKPGTIDYTELVNLGVFTQTEFEDRLKTIHDELLTGSNGEWVDYVEFLGSKSYEDKVLRAYLLAFLISEGRALLKIEPLTGRIWIMGLTERVKGPPKSVAISVAGGQ